MTGLTIYNGLYKFSSQLLEWDHTFWDLGDQKIQVGKDLKMGRVHVITLNQCVNSFQDGDHKITFSPTVTKIGSIFGHWIDYDGVGVPRGHRHTPSKN